MRLTLIHGWGFDRDFWQPLMAALPHHEFDCVDCGYFGKPHDISTDQASILVGHSLGFMSGIRMKTNWRGWIAINSFSRFVDNQKHAGCVPLMALRAIKIRLAQNPQKALNGFYRQIGTTAAPQGSPDILRLAAGLDTLEHGDISDVVTTSPLPHLVLAGAQDPLVPVAISQILQTTQGEFHLHPSGGHCLPQNETAWCAEKISQFLIKIF